MLACTVGLSLKGFANDNNLVSELRGAAQSASLHGGAGVRSTDVELSMRGVQLNAERRLSRMWEKEERLDASPVVKPVAGTETPGAGDGQAVQGAGTTGERGVAEDVGSADGGCAAGEIERLICDVWPEGEWATALRIARAESGTDKSGVLDGAWAVGNGSYGVFQLQASVHAPGIPDFWDHWMIPEFNVAWAYLIWADGGWRQWSTY